MFSDYDITTFDLDPYKMKIDEFTSIYSIYNIDDLNIIKSLKDKNIALKENRFTEKEYNHFIKRTANFINKITNVDNEETIIVTPQTSTPILSDIASELNNKSFYDIHIQLSGFKKNNPNDVVILEDKIKKEVKNEKQQDSIINMLEKHIEKFKKIGEIKMKNIKPVRNRRFLGNLFSFKNEEIKEKLLNKRILVIDDVLTSGSTLKYIYNSLLTTLTDPNNINMVTIFKR